MKKMTLKEAKAVLAVHSMTITKNRDGEYRVNFAGGTEAEAYYTEDFADALNTGIEMRRHLEASAKLASPEERATKAWAAGQVQTLYPGMPTDADPSERFWFPGKEGK